MQILYTEHSNSQRCNQYKQVVELMECMYKDTRTQSHQMSDVQRRTSGPSSHGYSEKYNYQIKTKERKVHISQHTTILCI